jgi:hypothetical protein
LGEAYVASLHYSMLLFFSTVKNYTFSFSNSTSRWNILIGALKVSLKIHADNKWASKAISVADGNSHILEVTKVITNVTLSSECVSIAKCLLGILKSFGAHYPYGIIF